MRARGGQQRRPHWESALEKFLKPWRRKPEVVAALAVGSRVQGTSTPNSDIDVHIILKPGVKWRQRGNCYVDGFLIEYFSNPVEQLKVYREADRQSFRRADARMFALGRIVFDKDGILRRLQASATRELTVPFRKLAPAELEMAKYGLWDDLDNLRDLVSAESGWYRYAHHLLLARALESYRRYLGAETGAPAKLERFFTDKSFRRGYAIPDFPDPEFVRLFGSAVRDETFRRIERLVRHVLRRMGGFEIDGWKLRSPVSALKRRG